MVFFNQFDYYPIMVEELSVQKDFPGWFGRETTEARHMESSLRYAMLENPGPILRETRFAFPYHRLIKGESYLLYLRSGYRWYREEKPLFCLDIGKVRDSEHFTSYGWVDFSVEDSHYNESPKKESKRSYRFGKIARANEGVAGTFPFVGRRVATYSNYGLAIADDIRREGVATTLITCARIVLKHVGVRTVLIDEIAHVENGDHEGGFYRSLNPYIFKTRPWSDFLSGQKGEMGEVALPTRATKLRPYVFK